MTRTTSLFQTVDEAYAACESAGLEPLRGFDYPSGEKFSVSFDGGCYQTYYGDRQFLCWANAFFCLNPGLLK